MPHLLTLLLGATYDSIEGRFRIIKREAAVLRAEIEQGERPEAPERGGAAKKSTAAESMAASSSSTGILGDKVKSPRKPRTPKKAGIKQEDGGRVLTGRVGKSGGSPTKGKNGSIMVKAEPMMGDDSYFGSERDIELETDLAPDTFMGALGKSDFDEVLRYEGGMGI